MEKINKSDEARLRRKAEILLKNKLSATGLQDPSHEAHELVHELNVHQIELEMQNSELKLAKEQDLEKQKLIHELEAHKIELEMQNEELILAKEQAERAIEKYAELYDFAPSGYVTLSREGEILEINLFASRMLGRERSRLTGSSLGFFISDETRATFNLFLEKVLLTKSSETCEVILSVDGNQPVCVHLTGIAAKNDKQCLVTMVDISERKRAETELKEKEFQYRNLANSGLALIWTAGPDMLCNFFNEPWLKFTGRTLAQETGNGWLAGVHPEDLDRCLNTYITAFDKRESFEMEYRLRHKSSEFRWILDMGSPSYDSNANFIGYIGNCFDITERKQAEEEIILLNAELENRVHQRTLQLEITNREIEAFSYSVSHDLRSPLRGIDGWSLALLEDNNKQLDEQGRIYLGRVRSEAQRMGNIIDDLLKLSRVTRTEMQMVRVDLSSLIQTIVNRIAETYPERQFEFLVEPGIFVSADHSLLEIALTNLLDNACKFTGHNLVARIEFGKVEVDNTPVFFIRDNGVGFEPDNAKNLFGPFQRMHRQSDFPGTGIGLATVKRVISRHGGRVWAESVPGEGATFYFTFN